MPVLSRRDVLRVGSAAVAADVTGNSWPAAYAAAPSRRPYLPYGRNSYLRAGLAGAPVDTSRTRQFRAFMCSHPEQRDCSYPRINGLAGNSWGTPHAMGRAHHPLWKLEGPHDPRADRLFTTGFHAPEWLGDMITGTSDSPLCVVDKASGLTLFCANAATLGSRRIRASAGAVTYHSSNGLDHRNRRSDDRRNITSRGRLSDAVVIRKDLIDYGIRHGTGLGHVLHLFLVETRTSDGFCGAMVGTEGGKNGFGAEGERIAISPSVNLSKRGLSPAAMVIARTLQGHGCYIGDNSGSQSALKAQQETRERPLWAGRLTRDSLRGITWDDFVVLRRGR